MLNRNFFEEVFEFANQLESKEKGFYWIINFDSVYHLYKLKNILYRFQKGLFVNYYDNVRLDGFGSPEHLNDINIRLNKLSQYGHLYYKEKWKELEDLNKKVLTSFYETSPDEKLPTEVYNRLDELIAFARYKNNRNLIKYLQDWKLERPVSSNRPFHLVTNTILRIQDDLIDYIAFLKILPIIFDRQSHSRFKSFDPLFGIGSFDHIDFFESYKAYEMFMDGIEYGKCKKGYSTVYYFFQFMRDDKYIKNISERAFARWVSEVFENKRWTKIQVNSLGNEEYYRLKYNDLKNRHSY